MKNFITEINRYFFYLVNYEGTIYLLYDNLKNKYFVSFIFYKKLSSNFEIILKSK